MIKCPTCSTSNLDTSRFCDECGSRLAAARQEIDAQPPAYVPPRPPLAERSVPEIAVPPMADISTPSKPQISLPRISHAASVDVRPAAFAYEDVASSGDQAANRNGAAHAVLIIERGDAPGTEFKLVNDESTVGRWDADNGVFPDVDLDAFDSDAKVSRRHARIRRSGGSYFIEDLGSTNGTYVNRGRRLLPGNTETLKDGDEIIVGKTFLRFQIMH